MPDPAAPAHPPGRRPAATSPWNLHLWQIQPIRDLLVIAAIIALIYLGYIVSLVTVPILLALLLAYLFEPLVRRMVRTPLFSRPGAAVLIIIALFAVFVVPVSIGVGTATVQGIHAARRVASTSGNFLNIMRFTTGVSERGSEFGSIDVPKQTDPPEAALAFHPGVPTTESKTQRARTAQLAYDRLPRYLKDLAKKIVAQRLTDAQAGPAAPGESQTPEAPSPDQLPGGVPEPQSPEPSAISINSRVSDLSALFDTAIAFVQDNALSLSGALGSRALGTGAEALNVVVRTLRALAKLGLTLFLTAFFFYFFSTGWGRVLAFWEGLIPERKKGRVVDLVEQMDRVIAGFVRGRLTICAILMVYYTLAYKFIGVDAWLLIGPLVGACALVPFLTALAIPLAIILMALQPDMPFIWQQSWWWIICSPFVLYFIDRALDDYVLTPAIQGRNTEMAVPAIVFASITGGLLAGVYGLLIAIPVAACLRILLREVFWPRFKAWAAGRERDFLPISQDEPGPPPLPPF